MNEYSKVYRSINKYINFATGEELLQYGRVYYTTGPARSYATQVRSKKKQFRSERSGKFEYFEFVETWCERADTWVRI